MKTYTLCRCSIPEEILRFYMYLYLSLAQVHGLIYMYRSLSCPYIYQVPSWQHALEYPLYASLETAYTQHTYTQHTYIHK